jgi:hypothetical protein
MKTNSTIILTIVTLCGLMMNPVAFSAQLSLRPLPVPAVRSTPAPRPGQPPSPAAAPAVAPIAISYETSAASNIAISVTAGQTGAPSWLLNTMDDTGRLRGPGKPMARNFRGSQRASSELLQGKLQWDRAFVWLHSLQPSPSAKRYRRHRR